jgi:hypothetical protein
MTRVVDSQEGGKRSGAPAVSVIDARQAGARSLAPFLTCSTKGCFELSQ